MQEGEPAAPVASDQASGQIFQILVEGNQRVEADTILSYMLVRPGDIADPRLINLSIQTLFATNLFADVRVAREGSTLIVYVRENPVINRVVLEGNRAINDQRINDEIQLQPRALFTRARSGRRAAHS